MVGLFEGNDEGFFFVGGAKGAMVGHLEGIFDGGLVGNLLGPVGLRDGREGSLVG
jgi:hypothetical protein